MPENLQDVNVAPLYENLFKESLDFLDHLNTNGLLVEPIKQLMEKFRCSDDMAHTLWDAWIYANQ